LANIVGQSFLKDYPLQVIYNGIDLNVFKPTPSDFRKKYHCEDKKLLLGVAFGWSERKGLDIFIRLAQELNDTYKIILVGTEANIDSHLPDNIISIHRTHDRQEMAGIYTAADLLVNPTREDTFPTVNMEALACGTPVLTFSTGGSPEIPDNSCGCVVKKDDYQALMKAVIRIFEKPFSAEDCRKRALQFSINQMLECYQSLLLK
jgi:glycosyltransferase involved in cell wall biosynthesis